MRFHQEEIVVLFHSVSLVFIPSAKPKVPCWKEPQPSFSVKQALTLKGYGAEIVEDVDLWSWVVIQIVAKRSRELRDLAACRSRSAIRRRVYVEPGADNSHINHWPNSDLLVAPAIGVHHPKVTQPQIRRRIEVCGECFPAEGEGARKRGITIPGGLRVFAHEFVFTVFSPVCKPDCKPELFAKIEVALKRNDVTCRSIRSKTRFT